MIRDASAAGRLTPMSRDASAAGHLSVKEKQLNAAGIVVSSFVYRQVEISASVEKSNFCDQPTSEMQRVPTVVVR
jgi:hypothetical protein